ncbi:MAG: hypothetical protein JXR37_21485 [Kiritimatiellae bacterium]|nr:hypothetical protein [Kiritimatiellia bacterium]
MQSYIEKSTGAKLPIRSQLENDGRPEIVVGAGRIAAGLGVTSEGLGHDAFFIRTVGNRLVILGRDDPRRRDTGSCTGPARDDPRCVSVHAREA